MVFILKRSIAYISLIASILLIFSNCTKKNDFPILKGSYLGQKPPGMTPELFAPGIISTGYNENCAAFTTDGKELYYWLMERRPFFVILCLKEENGKWTSPQVFPFSGKYFDGKVTISPDGSKLCFSSNRPREKNGEPINNWDLWISERAESGWGEPKNFGPVVNTDAHDAYPCLARNENLYFFSDREGGEGEDDMWVSRFINGHYTEPKNLGPSINTSINEGDPFIAPDESYIIFCSRDRKEGFGENDLYISFRREDGSWKKAKNMGERINSAAEEVCPIVSSDGKYFFFSSTRATTLPYPETPFTFEQIKNKLNSPGNGSNDIYWGDAKIIEELKPEKLK